MQMSVVNKYNIYNLAKLWLLFNSSLLCKKTAIGSYNIGLIVEVKNTKIYNL